MDWSRTGDGVPQTGDSIKKGEIVNDTREKSAAAKIR